MIAFERLLALALGELDDAASAEVDEHVLACGACAATLERLLHLGEAVRALVRDGKARFALTPALAAEIERTGLVTRTYRLAPGGSVACSVGAEDVYVASHLEADLAGVTRVDLVKTLPSGVVRVEDVPFDAEGGVVRYIERGDFLRTLPTTKVTVELVAVDGGLERAIGRYVFDHRGFSGR